MLRQLDMNLLGVLEALLETQSTKAAALRLGVSQPTVSFSLKKLRAALDDPLFIRTSHGLQPTPAALRLRGPLTQIFAIVREDVLAPPQFDPVTTEREFVFGMSDVSEAVFLPTLSRHLLERAPRATVRAAPLDRASLENHLASGTIDLAFGDFAGIDKAALFQQRLFYRKFVCIMGATNPLAARGRLTLKQFAAADHAVVDRGVARSAPEAALARMGIRRRIRLYCSSFLSVPSILRETSLIMVVPEDIARILAEPGVIRILPLPFASPNLHVKQLWHRRFHNDPANQWLRAETAQLFMNGPMTEAATGRRSTARTGPARHQN